MTLFQDPIKQKIKIDLEKKAVTLAMNSRWKDAMVLNRTLIASFPQDFDARNRLGKALMELGETSEAKSVFANVLSNYPNNSIAKKNFERLNQIKDQRVALAPTGMKSPRSFIEESGKSALTALVNIGNIEERFSQMPGQLVDLRIIKRSLLVYSADEIYLGQVESRLGTRLINLMNGGNQYDALITSVEGNKLTVIIREKYQHPSMSGRMSFLSRADSSTSTDATYFGEENEFEENGISAEPEIGLQDWHGDDTGSVGIKEFYPVGNDEEFHKQDDDS